MTQAAGRDDVDRAPERDPGRERPDGPAHVCTACSLLCDDVVPAGGVLAAACAAGQAAWSASLASTAGGKTARVDGRDVSWEEGLDRAAALVTAARRVLVSGLRDASLDAITAACDLAEACGAAVDGGDPEAARLSGDVLARVGRVTAEWDELRDRADLVVLWWCDPAVSHPRFLERFVLPPLPGGQRRTIAVGTDPVLPRGAHHLHVQLAPDTAVTAARALHGLLAGPQTAAHVPPDLGRLLDPVHRAIDSAKAVAFVTSPTADATGLVTWSMASLVRALALSRVAFEIPLPRHAIGGGANALGAAAVCTWRYGSAGAVSRADRHGSRSLPGEDDAERLVGRSEVDCVVAVGGLPEALETAITSRGHDLSVVRLGADASPRRETGVLLRVPPPLVTQSGAMLRGDGRWVDLGGTATSPRPDPLCETVRDLLDRVARRGPRRPSVGVTA